MKCPKCKAENPETKKFCRKCGIKLTLTCPQCGAEIFEEDDFCGDCGNYLRAQKDGVPIDFEQPQSYTPKYLADKILTTRSSMEGERKLVTVLFADVANYTSMSEKLDPEEVHLIMDSCFKILMDEIHRYEGTVNQFTGDGVMALFGAPVAHEDHAQRACRAALGIKNAMRDQSRRVRNDFGVDFEIRLGLNSGPVIVGSIGDDLRMDYTAVGDTTNLAARIQQACKPGEAWMSQKTHHIIRGYFRDDMVGDIELKGKAEAQTLYRLISQRVDVRTRFEAGLVRGVTELVGRRPEIKSLLAAFERVKSGEGQVVDIVGEAGLGKSRLVYEFKKELGGDVTFLTGVCTQYGQNVNYLPVIDIVKGAFGIEEGMTEAEAGLRIEEQSTKETAQMTPFYRSLLSIKVDDFKFKALNPEGRKFGTFEAVKNLLIALSDQQPLILFLEDVHWMDKISESLFTYVARCILDQPILMLSAYRPEGTPPWAQGAHYQRLGLETLSPKSSVRLIRNILNIPALEPELEKKIVQKTEGNPFFVEEIVKELLERGDLVKAGDYYVCNSPIDQCEIPDTIQGVLAARMDRLNEDLKRTMQVASVIGRDFAFRILKSILELGEELRSQMANLVGLEILYEKALYPELEYIFKHALTQEVAYDSLLKQRRREIHSRIAQTIEELYAERIEEHYESVAHHYERGGNAEKAVKYLILAGEKSNHYGAVQAASEFLGKALEVSKKVHLVLDSETEVRLHYELAQGNMGIGAVGIAAEGFGKAIELSRRFGMTDYERKSLRYLAIMTQMLPMKAEAEKILQEGLVRAQELQDKGLEGSILAMMGVLAAIYERHSGGHRVIDAERMALESRDQESIVTARVVRAYWERWLGSPRKTVELTEGLVEILSSMYNISAVSNVIWVRGIALAELGRIADALTTFENGIEQCERFGAFYRLGNLYNSLGYCYSEIHQPEKSWVFNKKSANISRTLMEKYPMGRRQWAHCLGEANANLVENLMDQGDLDASWKRLMAMEEESKSPDFDMNRYQWESRMQYLVAHLLMSRNDIDQAEAVILKNLEKVRKDQLKKREGSFLRILGEVQMRRQETDNATATLHESIRILKEVENPRQLWQAHGSLAAVYDETGRSSEAREQWGAASQIIQNTADGLTDRELRDQFLHAGPIRKILSKSAMI